MRQPRSRERQAGRNSLARVVGAELRRLRLAAGFSADGLGYLCDTSGDYISFLERGKNVPSLDITARIVRVCESSLEAFGRAVDAALEDEQTGKDAA